jgi:hypothetical protein
VEKRSELLMVSGAEVALDRDKDFSLAGDGNGASLSSILDSRDIPGSWRELCPFSC